MVKNIGIKPLVAIVAITIAILVNMYLAHNRRAQIIHMTNTFVENLFNGTALHHEQVKQLLTEIQATTAHILEEERRATALEYNFLFARIDIMNYWVRFGYGNMLLRGLRQLNNISDRSSTLDFPYIILNYSPPLFGPNNRVTPFDNPPYVTVGHMTMPLLSRNIRTEGTNYLQHYTALNNMATSMLDFHQQWPVPVFDGTEPQDIATAQRINWMFYFFVEFFEEYPVWQAMLDV